MPISQSAQYQLNMMASKTVCTQWRGRPWSCNCFSKNIRRLHNLRAWYCWSAEAVVLLLPVGYLRYLVLISQSNGTSLFNNLSVVYLTGNWPQLSLPDKYGSSFAFWEKRNWKSWC